MSKSEKVNILTPIIHQAYIDNETSFEDIATPSVKSPEAVKARQQIIYQAYCKGLSFPVIGKAINMHYATVSRQLTIAMKNNLEVFPQGDL